MEINEHEEGENQDNSGEKEEMLTLPEEWVYPTASLDAMEDNSRNQDDHTRGHNEKSTADRMDNTLQEQAETNSKKQEQAKTGGKAIKKKWGPIIVERRSNRYVEDGKTVLEKAQEVKRKWDEEDIIGKIKQKPLHISFDDLNNVVVVIGIVDKDGNPISSKVVREIEALEEEKHINHIDAFSQGCCSLFEKNLHVVEEVGRQ
jgi:hypothetical protein